MGVVAGVLDALAAFASRTMAQFGPAGLFVLMAMESMVIPIPSEAVMPLAGALVAAHEMNLWGALIAACLGSLAGSWIGYGMGAWGLKPLLERYGRWILVGPHRLEQAHAWLDGKGAWAIFVSRFIPGVRHVISVPAGSARMEWRPFTVATLGGATLWNVFLFWVGYRYGPAVAAGLKPYLDVVGLALLVLVVGYVWYELRKRE
ncbi:MAG: DedA family protein [Thermoplasmatota archaeon]